MLATQCISAYSHILMNTKYKCLFTEGADRIECSTLKIQNWIENFSLIAMPQSLLLESTETITAYLAQS